MFIATARASIFITWLSAEWRVVEVTMECIRSVVGVYTERLWSVIGVTSGQGRDNVGTRSGQPFIAIDENRQFW